MREKEQKEYDALKKESQEHRNKRNLEIINQMSLEKSYLNG